jgi:hypothetical protein
METSYETTYPNRAKDIEEMLMFSYNLIRRIYVHLLLL